VCGSRVRSWRAVYHGGVVALLRSASIETSSRDRRQCEGLSPRELADPVVLAAEAVDVVVHRRRGVGEEMADLLALPVLGDGDGEAAIEVDRLLPAHVGDELGGGLAEGGEQRVGALAELGIAEVDEADAVALGEDADGVFLLRNAVFAEGTAAAAAVGVLVAERSVGVGEQAALGEPGSRR